MTDLIEPTFHSLSQQLPDRVSLPGDDRYAKATQIWAKPVGDMPRAIVHCRNAEDVQTAIRAARERDLPLSVRGGGHDWAGRALCDGIVIDLGEMRSVVVSSDHRTATISGGARAGDVTAVTDPFHLAAVAGSVGSVGMTGLALGGGYGPLIGRFGLALDNVLAAQIVLADGSIVSADPENNAELFWALRGGGGNFGVVTAMRHRLHDVPSVHSGLLVYPFSEAKAVLEGCAAVAASAPEELTVQLALVADPQRCAGGAGYSNLVRPARTGRSPFPRLGTLLAGTIERKSYGALLTTFDAHIVNGLRAVMETCWIPALDSGSIDVFIRAMENAARRDAPSSPTNSKAPLPGWRPMRPPSAFVATMCLSRRWRPSPIDLIQSRSNSIGNGRAAPGKPLRRRCPAGIRTFSASTMPIAPQIAMAATLIG
jgi:hypothetical protein